MRIGLLYHWAPADRRAQILREGLRPGRACTVATTRLGYVCLGFSASGAWALSGGTVDHVDVWDLWQVQLSDADSVTVRPEFGTLMQEVMVRGPIPVGQLWLVGTRAVGQPAPDRTELAAR